MKFHIRPVHNGAVRRWKLIFKVAIFTRSLYGSIIYWQSLALC